MKTEFAGIGIHIMDTRRNTIIVLVIFGFVACGILALIGWQSYDTRSALQEKPVVLSLAKLLKDGSGGARHVKLVDFGFGARYVGSQQKGTAIFDIVWVPVFPLHDNRVEIEAVVTFRNVPGPNAVDHLTRQREITGTCSDGPRWLGATVGKQLRDSYPGAGNSSAWVIDVGQEMPSESAIYWLLGLSVLAFAASLAGVVYLRMETWKAGQLALLEPDYAPDDFPSDEGQLGKLEQEFQPTVPKHILVIVFCSVTLLASLVGLALAAIYLTGIPRVVLVLVAALAAGGSFLGIHSMRQRLRWRVRLHENGFVWEKPQGAEIVVWQKIRRYRELRMIMNGMETDHQFAVQMLSGRQVKLDSTIRNLALLAHVVGERSYRYRLARAQQNLLSHHPVRFGSITMTADGLEQNGKLLPWFELESVAVEQNGVLNLLIVRKKGETKPWFKASAPGFPNLDVFIAMSNERIVGS